VNKSHFKNALHALVAWALPTASGFDNRSMVGNAHPTSVVKAASK